ncbi:hypothetical protein L4C34_15545 [Vibrio profundum]|uniref:hypothetical protein n=1 Tax=Vibrio profundum TaxID=2910247 RepID=UPI003D11A63C
MNKEYLQHHDWRERKLPLVMLAIWFIASGATLLLAINLTETMAQVKTILSLVDL